MIFDAVIRSVERKQSFTGTTELITIGSNDETPLLLLKNPSGSAGKMLVTHFKFGTDSSNTRSLIRIYSNPTVTSDGTGLTETNTYVTSSPPSAEAQLFKLPTVSSNGSVLNLDINPINSHSKGLNRTYWIDPGNSILMTVENSMVNASTFADIYWLEGV